MSGNRIAKKQFAPAPPPSILQDVTIICLEFQKKNYIDESSDGFSEEDEEDQKDYRLGGYHPVEVFPHYFLNIFRLVKFLMTVIKFYAKWVGVSIPQFGLSEINHPIVYML